MTAVQSIAKNAKYLLWILAAGTAFVALKFTFLSPPSVRLVTVTTRDLTAQVYGNGTVEAKVVVDVSSKITGRIVAATIIADVLGTWERALRMKCTRHRCQQVPDNVAAIAFFKP